MKDKSLEDFIEIEKTILDGLRDLNDRIARERIPLRAVILPVVGGVHLVYEVVYLDKASGKPSSTGKGWRKVNPIRGEVRNFSPEERERRRKHMQEINERKKQKAAEE